MLDGHLSAQISDEMEGSMALSVAKLRGAGACLECLATADNNIRTLRKALNFLGTFLGEEADTIEGTAQAVELLVEKGRAHG